MNLSYFIGIGKLDCVGTSSWLNVLDEALLSSPEEKRLTLKFINNRSLISQIAGYEGNPSISTISKEGYTHSANANVATGKLVNHDRLYTFDCIVK